MGRADSSEGRQYTTLMVPKSLHSRLAELKPYETMSYHELVSEMADQYEKRAD